MTRAAHPILAGLVRAGGAPARLAAALRAGEARLATLDVDLESHPLCRPGPWEALTAGDTAGPRLADLLVRLARSGDGQSGAAPARPAVFGTGLPNRPDRGAAGSATSAGEAGSTPATAGGRLRSRKGPAHGVAAPDADAKAERGVLPQADTGPRPRSALPDAGPGPHRRDAPPAAEPPIPAPAPRGLASLDPALRAAAARPVAPLGASALGRLAASILDGAPISAAAGPGRVPSGDAGSSLAGVAERRIEVLLTRIVGGPAAVPAARAPVGPADRTPMPDPGARAPLPAPRSGIERLLARGRRENLMPPGHSAASEARPAPDRPAAFGPQPLPGPDLAGTGRAPRDSAPALGQAFAPDDPQDFARALTDLLRSEARSAGIDLRRGS